MALQRSSLALFVIGGVLLGGCDVLNDGPVAAEAAAGGQDGPEDDGTTGPDGPDGPDDPDGPDGPDDDTDGGSGTIRVAVDVSTDRANALGGLTFAANGMIYVAGHGGTGRAMRTVVGRFDAAGAPDAAFGEGGFVSIDLDDRDERAVGIVELADGDVLVAVNVEEPRDGQSVYLLRFDDVGTQLRSPDWGDRNGVVEVVFGWRNSDNNRYSLLEWPNDTAWDMQLDNGAGQRVVIFGSGPSPRGSDHLDGDRYIVRVSAVDGSVDPAFNDGRPFAYDSARRLDDHQRHGLVESDGSIVSAGYTDFGDELGAHVVVVKLTAAGELDGTFGNFVGPTAAAADLGLEARPGVAIFNPFAEDGGVVTSDAVARQSDGSYVTTGNGLATGDETGNTRDLASFRLGGASVDTSWGNSGAQIVGSEALTNDDRGSDLVALPDDRTVHVGSYDGNAAVFVLTAEGGLDSQVDGDGIIELGHLQIGAPLLKAARSADGTRIAATTDTDSDGARLIVLSSN